jgi:pyruvate/2-oxoglutarate/acetoin dehydrogenase E1 component
MRDEILLSIELVIDLLQCRGKLVVCEDRTQTAGWAAECCLASRREPFELLSAPPRRVPARGLAIANTSTLEQAVLLKSKTSSARYPSCARSLGY